MSDAESAPAATPAPSPEELTRAFKAFKKRLKLTQLDFDSRIGANPLSGHASGIVAIAPPREYPRAVWDALVAQGKLKRASQGQYRVGAAVSGMVVAKPQASWRMGYCRATGSWTSTSQPVLRGGSSAASIDDAFDRAPVGFAVGDGGVAVVGEEDAARAVGGRILFCRASSSIRASSSGPTQAAVPSAWRRWESGGGGSGRGAVGRRSSTRAGR